MIKVVSLIIMISAAIVTVAPSQEVRFKREQLSQKGQLAYDRLFSACVFSIGGVGYAAVTSQEELALYDLLEEPHAVEALKSLVSEASYEGGLFGLVGLSLKNNTEFNRAVDVYKARRQRPHRSKSPGCRLVNADNDEQVITQSGCLIIPELRSGVVTRIQSGGYDIHLLPKYRPRQSAKNE